MKDKPKNEIYKIQSSWTWAQHLAMLRDQGSSFPILKAFYEHYIKAVKREMKEN